MSTILEFTQNKYNVDLQQEVSEFIVEFQQGYYPIPTNLENYYTKPESDGRFKPINYVPTWSEVTEKPLEFPPSTHINNDNTVRITEDTKFAISGEYLTHFQQSLETWSDNVNTSLTSLGLEIDDKFDNPDLSINIIPFWHQSGTFFNSNMSYINGNIGIGLPGAATEKLEIGGRSKSDGQVFNETTSAILPREIKYKGGNFVGAKEGGIERKFLMEGDAAILQSGWKFGYGNGNISSNTAIGNITLNANTTGSYNTAIGNGSLYSNTTGAGNTAIGAQPLYLNTSGGDNIAIGFQTLYFNTTGSRNVTLGNSAGRNAGSDNNTAIGHSSLRGGSGGNNTAVGYSAMYTNTTGAYNASLGTNSLYQNTTGSSNVALGHNSLYQNTTGSENIGVGDAMHGNTTGSYNISLGHGSLYFHTAPTKIIALGRYTLRGITSGTDNIAIGYFAGQYYGGVINFLTSATNCILLGTNSAPLNDNSQNEIVIGHNAIGSGNNTATIGNVNTETLHLLKNGAGVVLKSPDGTKKVKISIDNNGNLITSLI